MQKNTRSNNLSFLDVLFGALGAVLILFIIMLSMSGAPPRIRTPLNRSYKWEIEFPGDVSFSNDPLHGEILICTESLDKKISDAADSKESLNCNTAVSMRPISGKGFNCSSPDETPFQTDLGHVLVKYKNDVSKNRVVVTVSLELAFEDESWIDEMILKLNSTQWTKSKVSISPGDSEKSTKEIKNTCCNNDDTYFLSIVKLVEEKDGLLPRVDVFVNVVRSE